MSWFHAILGAVNLIGVLGFLSEEWRARRKRRDQPPPSASLTIFAVLYLAPVIIGAVIAIQSVLT